jgi:rod shape-determining protein MreD
VAVSRRISFGHIFPDLIIPAVTFFGLYGGLGNASLAGICAGVFRDVAGCDAFGMGILAVGMCGLIAGLIGNKLYRESPVSQFLIVFVLVVASYAIHFAGGLFLGYRPDIQWVLRTVILPHALYSGLLGIPMFMILGRII